jgi:predicted PurR-regulated permease PerM
MGVIGGALAFGLVRVFLGPTLLAVTYRVIEEWSSVNALLQSTQHEQINTIHADATATAGEEATGTLG